ncbi:MAG: CoA transferase [Acetobacteraceae bacterium]|nr:CoA transferase [Acetobacteraceae bacterium]
MPDSGHSTSRLGRFVHGVRVLDLSWFLPGPLASLLLADMGAEVLKIEPPSGDPMRELGPRDAAGHAVFHAAVNAGKTVLRLDLKRPEDHAAFLDLVRGADVLIEGFRPGVMARLGADWPTLQAVNPRLVYCSISGYGAAGPLSQAAGHDNNYLATAGVMHRNGDGMPAFLDPPVADGTGALFAALAILGALHARDRDGAGCHIDLGLADAPMPLQLFQVAGHGATGHVPQPGETYLNGGAAFYHTYRCADGRHVTLGAIEPKFWRAFCTAAARPDWISRQSDPLPQTALMAEVRDLLARLTRDEAIARFGTADCCFSAVLDLGEAVASRHHEARRLVRRAADGALQTLFPAWVDGVPPAPRAPMREATAETSVPPLGGPG